MNKITIDYKNDSNIDQYGRDFTLTTEIGENFTELVVLFRKFCVLLDFPQELINKYITPCEEENLERLAGIWEFSCDDEDVCENTTEK